MNASMPGRTLCSVSSISVQTKCAWQLVKEQLLIQLASVVQFSSASCNKLCSKYPRASVFLLLTSSNYLAAGLRDAHHHQRQIVAFPLALRCCPLLALRRRHEFLLRLRKANYVPKTADHITLEQFSQHSDRFFAEEIARTPIADFNRFIKIIFKIL
ncbi:hypothetical protein niasHS_008637 [Heterodera schachtii]|uniref:Uncharacterized protein n=1 Tax=Heterodera schachtii TaxID=97005 RepID=A0ABD2J9M1_HETSC